MTYVDNQAPVAQVTGWLSEGYATWGGQIADGWVEYPIDPAGAHPLAAVLERHQHGPAAAVIP